jgi:predicted phosphoribosyltransferase
MREDSFQNRREAGQRLADRLKAYRGRRDLVVWALPRGGVPVAYEVAKALQAPLDVFTVRKLGVPGQEELAMGAMATGGEYYLDEDLISQLRIPQHQIDAVIESEYQELQRREDLYRPHRPPLDPRGKTVILVDDGLATGASLLTAVKAVRHRDPQAVVIAVPVAAASSVSKLAGLVSDLVCVLTPRYFRSVGDWYRDFSQTTDNEVIALLGESNDEPRQDVTGSTRRFRSADPP